MAGPFETQPIPEDLEVIRELPQNEETTTIVELYEVPVVIT